MPEPTSQPYKFDESNFNSKAEKLKALVQSTKGQKNKNPFVWFQKTVEPLVVKFKKGERTKELADAMSAIKEEVPLINPEIKEDAPTKA